MCIFTEFYRAGGEYREIYWWGEKLCVDTETKET
jgi:hypothetical protein